MRWYTRGQLAAVLLCLGAASVCWAQTFAPPSGVGQAAPSAVPPAPASAGPVAVVPQSRDISVEVMSVPGGPALVAPSDLAPTPGGGPMPRPVTVTHFGHNEFIPGPNPYSSDPFGQPFHPHPAMLSGEGFPGMNHLRSPFSKAQLEQYNARQEAQKKLQAAEQEIQAGLQKLRQERESNPSAAATFRTQLAQLLGTQFDIREGLREQELKNLEEQLAELRRHVQRRRDKKSEIVDHRAEQLLRDIEGLGWSSEGVPTEPNRLEPLTLPNDPTLR